MKRFWLSSVVLLISFFLPIMAGAQTHYSGQVRRTINLQSSMVSITTSRYLELRCWLDPWEYLGCDPFYFIILVQSTVGNSTVTATCNDQLARTFQVSAGKWTASFLGDWNRYLRPGWNTIKIENKTRGAVAYVGRISIDITPASWHDEIAQLDRPGLAIKRFFGLIHFHTNEYPADDGSVPLTFYVEEGKKRGWDFIIPTGHDPTAQQQWARAQECKQLTIPGKFSVIPGDEESTTWKQSTYSKSSSHALLLYFFGSYMMEQLHSKLDYQQYINREANACGALLIAAHPFLVTNAPFKFDFRNVQSTFAVKGMEYFGYATSAQEAETFAKVLEFVKNRQACVLTSSCDYHNGWDPQAEERLQRTTEVFGCENTWAGIMRSIISGRTCATARGASLESATFLPGSRSYYAYGTPVLSFSLRFKGRQNATVAYELYRDGAKTPIAQVSKKINGTNVLVTFETKDSSASKGEHWYIMRAKLNGTTVLVTSPIVITRL